MTKFATCLRMAMVSWEKHNDFIEDIEDDNKTGEDYADRIIREVKEIEEMREIERGYDDYEESYKDVSIRDEFE